MFDIIARPPFWNVIQRKSLKNGKSLTCTQTPAHWDSFGRGLHAEIGFVVNLYFLMFERKDDLFEIHDLQKF